MWQYLIPAAAGLGGSALEYLGGAEDRKRDRQLWDWMREDRNRLIKQMDQPVFNPYGVAAAGRRGIAQQVQGRGSQIDRTLGLDTGEGQGALWGGMLGDQYDLLTRAIMEEAMARSRRNTQIGTNLLGMGVQ